jgi:CheY-like chemotaxis protein
MVRDNGGGIAHHELERIFEPFVAESQGPGAGATFTVELPIAMAAPDARPAVPPTPERAAENGQAARLGIRVLIVDDNTDVAELLAEALGIAGFDTATAHDAESALERWREFAPDAGVLDVGLPDMDGYELARRLRAEHGTRPALIAATGYGQRGDRERAAAAGFDCHFVKPVSVQDLVRAIQSRFSQQSG